jgi:hypothetical protein
MSLPLPRLDDRTWQDLRDEGVSLIPRFAPTWTDFNVSDPGITVVELLAYYTELDLYRLDQIGAPFSRAFLRLIGERYLPVGPRPAVTLLEFDPVPGQPPSPVESLVVAGSYFVPRQSPTNPGVSRRVPRVTGIGKSDGSFPYRSAGEPDEPLLHPAPTEDLPTVPEFGFRAAHDLDLTAIRLAAVQSFDGQSYRDITNLLVRAQSAAVWGTNPVDPQGRSAGQQPAVYIGMNLKRLDPARLRQPTNDKPGWALTLWCVPSGFDSAALSSPGPSEFEPPANVVAPPDASEKARSEFRGFRPYDPQQPTLSHHGLKVVWEYRLDGQWRAVPMSGSFRDETRGFTRPGRVIIPGAVFRAASPSANQVIGAIPAAHFYLRARLSEGLPDTAPALRGLFVDAVLVEQWDRAGTPFARRSTQSTNPPQAVPPAFLRELQMTEEAEADVNDAAADLARRGWGPDAAGWGGWPLWSANGFDASRPDENPTLEVDVSAGYAQNRISAVVLGVSNGEPNQGFPLPCSPTNTRFKPESPNDEDDGPTIRVMTDNLRVWTLEPPWGWVPGEPGRPPQKKWRAVQWGRVPDLMLGARNAPDFTYDPTPTGESTHSRYTPPGRIVFGDGENGRVPPLGSLIVASYSWTVAEAANFSAGFIWARSTDREPYHPELVKAYPTVRFRNPLPVAGGQIEEPLSEALNRLANEFAAPEELIELADSGGRNTLDGLEVSSVQPPAMAVNLLDFECLARTVPSTQVARAKAWAEIDPRFPGVVAPGAITVVIVPSLPANRPMPTDGLLGRVRAFLLERRPLACRLFVIGPEYTPLRVQAALHTTVQTVESVRKAADAAVRQFLHPISGGSLGTGWPFGRDVHTGELMRILAAVSDVRHVTGLRLAAGDGEWTEAAVGVPARALVELTELLLDVLGDA